MSDTLTFILDCEKRGVVTRTFRRLDPERQQVVFAAILEEAADAGPANLNVKKVAGRAGVAVGSLYQYFGSRENLLDFAMELVLRSTLEQFGAYREVLAALPLEQGLPAYLEGGLEWSREQVAVARFFAAAAYQGNPELAERIIQPMATVMREMVHEMLLASAARGEVRPTADMEATARLLNALLIILGDVQLLPYLNHYFQLVDDEMPPQRLMAALLDLLRRGLSSSTGGAA